jgi:hypothetical protein
MKKEKWRRQKEKKILWERIRRENERRKGVQEHNLVMRSSESRKRKGRIREVEKERRRRMRRVVRYQNHIRRRGAITFLWTNVSETFSFSFTR